MIRRAVTFIPRTVAHRHFATQKTTPFYHSSAYSASFLRFFLRGLGFAASGIAAAPIACAVYQHSADDSDGASSTSTMLTMRAAPTTNNMAHAAAAAQPPFNYKQARADLEALFDKDMSLAPAAIRLAWHAAGSWDAKRKDGGSNTATMRFKKEASYGANNGLGRVRNALEGIKKKHPSISYADLWVLAATTAIAVMSGPEIPFKWGRVDATDDSTCSPDGRLPDAAQTQSHIRCVFGRMGFSDEETVALIGAHAVGECHREYSGFVGPWTFDKYGFGNQFYTTLLENDWVVNTKEPVLQYTDVATRKLLMLPGDVAFLIDPKFRKYVELFAKDGDLWARKFSAAFTKMMEFNTSGLTRVA